MSRLANWSTRAAAALGSAVFLALLASLLHVDGVPIVIVGALGALVIAASLKPDVAVLAVALLVPIAQWLGRGWNHAVAWPETLIVSFCAGYCARIAARQSAPHGALHAPLVLLAGFVVASYGVQVLVDGWRFGAASVRADLWRLVTTRYFLPSTSAASIDATMRLLESLVICAAAASTVRSRPTFARPLACAIAAGATAAGAVNLLRIWEAAARLESPVLSFFGHLAVTRFNAHYADLNAAGSYFVMALFVTAGLSLTKRGKPWFAAALVIAAATWLTGSRAALIVGLMALLAPAAAVAFALLDARMRKVALAAAAAALAVTATAAAYYLPHRGNQRSASVAMTVRWELAQTSFRMAASRPSFGVGVGGYYSRSGEFSSARLLDLFPPAVHENAHNNYLQVLAELGIAGFAAFIWLLGTGAVLCARWLRADSRDPLRWGIATGILAFMLSWFGGHPLLIDEPAVTFWLLVGVAAGSGMAVAGDRRDRRVWLQLLVPLLLMVIAASMPFRVQQMRGDFNLDHQGIGLSPWQAPMEGVRYRVALAGSSVFLPADAKSITLPLRAYKEGEGLRLELLLDGRPADVIDVPSDRWHQLRLVLPNNGTDAKYRRLDLRVSNPKSADAGILLVGKVEPR
jgi:O-antigen ligase